MFYFPSLVSEPQIASFTFLSFKYLTLSLVWNGINDWTFVSAQPVQAPFHITAELKSTKQILKHVCQTEDLRTSDCSFVTFTIIFLCPSHCIYPIIIIRVSFTRPFAYTLQTYWVTHFWPRWSQVLSDLLVHLAKLVPEEQGQDGVRAEPEIRGPQAFVEPHHALLPQRLREAVDEPFIKLPLKSKLKTHQTKTNRKTLPL